MDDKTINDSLFEPINNGFGDVAKPIRELTLKSMLSLAGKLNEKNLNDRLMRSLAKMQV
jgi:SCY1-like protein 1